jgi:hypothetical protein
VSNNISAATAKSKIIKKVGDGTKEEGAEKENVYCPVTMLCKYKNFPCA